MKTLITLTLLSLSLAAIGQTPTAANRTLIFSGQNCNNAGCVIKLPANVSVITVEAWGGGAGGYLYAGGQGGGYFKAILTVTDYTVPTLQLNVSVGLGGAGSATSTSNAGLNTTISFTDPTGLGAVNLVAYGGNSGTFPGGYGNPGQGSGTVSAVRYYFRGAAGQYGSNSKITAVAANATNYVMSGTGGDGGESGGSTNSKGHGGSEVCWVQSVVGVASCSNGIFTHITGSNGAEPGGGGGGAPNLTQKVAGGAGGNGLLIITY